MLRDLLLLIYLSFFFFSVFTGVQQNASLKSEAFSRKRPNGTASRVAAVLFHTFPSTLDLFTATCLRAAGPRPQPEPVV